MNSPNNLSLQFTPASGPRLSATLGSAEPITHRQEI